MKSIIGEKQLSKKQLKQILPSYKEIVNLINSANDIQDKDKDSLPSSVHNVVSILGPRGSGKSSVFKNLYSSLTKKDENNKKDEKYHIIFPPIIPEKVDNKIDLLGVVLMNINDFIKNNKSVFITEDRNSTHCIRRNKSEIQEGFDEVFSIYYKKDKSYKDILRDNFNTSEEYSENMKAVINAELELSKKLKLLINKILDKWIEVKGEKANNAKMAFMFDDADINPKRANEVFDILLKYLDMDRVFVFIAADYSKLKNNLSLHYYKDHEIIENISSLCEIGFRADRAIDEYIYDLLKKVMPISNRYNLLELDKSEILKFSITSNDENKKNKTLKDLLENCIKTYNPTNLELVFYETIATIFDDRPRGLMNICNLLDSLEQIQDSNENKENSKILFLKKFLDSIIATNKKFEPYRNEILEIVRVKEYKKFELYIIKIRNGILEILEKSEINKNGILEILENLKINENEDKNSESDENEKIEIYKNEIKNKISKLDENKKIEIYKNEILKILNEKYYDINNFVVIRYSVLQSKINKFIENINTNKSNNNTNILSKIDEMELKDGLGVFIDIIKLCYFFEVISNQKIDSDLGFYRLIDSLFSLGQITGIYPKINNKLELLIISDYISSITGIEYQYLITSNSDYKRMLKNKLDKYKPDKYNSNYKSGDISWDESFKDNTISEQMSIALRNFEAIEYDPEILYDVQKEIYKGDKNNVNQENQDYFKIIEERALLNFYFNIISSKIESNESDIKEVKTEVLKGIEYCYTSTITDYFRKKESETEFNEIIEYISKDITDNKEGTLKVVFDKYSQLSLIFDEILKNYKFRVDKNKKIYIGSARTRAINWLTNNEIEIDGEKSEEFKKSEDFIKLKGIDPKSEPEPKQHKIEGLKIYRELIKTNNNDTTNTTNTTNTTDTNECITLICNKDCSSSTASKTMGYRYLVGQYEAFLYETEIIPFIEVQKSLILNNAYSKLEQQLKSYLKNKIDSSVNKDISREGLLEIIQSEKTSCEELLEIIQYKKIPLVENKVMEKDELLKASEIIKTYEKQITLRELNLKHLNYIIDNSSSGTVSESLNNIKNNLLTTGYTMQKELELSISIAEQLLNKENEDIKTITIKLYLEEFKKLIEKNNKKYDDNKNDNDENNENNNEFILFEKAMWKSYRDALTNEVKRAMIEEINSTNQGA